MNNLASIYGADLVKDMLKVHYETSDIQIDGYIAKPHLARNDKTQQSLYINHRWIKNEELVATIYDAYHSLLFVNKHPIVVLNLELDPTKIDVNVHPNKSEVKIEQISTVKNALYTAVKETLQKNNLIPVMDFSFEQQLTFAQPAKKSSSEFKSERKEANERKEAKYTFEPSQQTVMLSSKYFTELQESQQKDRQENQQENTWLKTTEENNGLLTEDNNNKNEEIDNSDQEEKQREQEKEKEKKGLSDNKISSGIFIPEHVYSGEISGNIKLPPMKILGQIHKTFFVAETEGGLLIIDQHVVQERVLYERFMNEYLNKNIAIQKLLLLHMDQDN